MKNKRTRLRQGYGGQAKSAQDISIRQAQDKQDEIFRKMSFKTKLKLSCDFMAYGLKYNLAENIKIPMSYLRSWMKKNKLKF